MRRSGCAGGRMSTELDPRRWWMLPVILVGSFLSFLDFFIVNIALPAIHDDLGARPAQLQFVVAGYGIGFAVSLITGGRLGRHLRTQARVPGGDRRVHAGVGAVWTGGKSDNADRLARPAGDDGGHADAAGAGDYPRRVRAARASVRDRTVRHVDGLCLDRGAGAGRGVGQHQPVRLVVAVDLPDQRPDRAGSRSALPRWCCASRAVSRDLRWTWLVSASYRPRCSC